MVFFGQMAEWLKATDCKSVHVSVRRFEPYSAHKKISKLINVKIAQLYCKIVLR